MVYLIVLFAYLFGSIPFGLILVHLFGSGDLRSEGSGNIGATNVMRTQEKRWLGILTFVCDALKGAVPVWLSLASGVAPIAGLAAVIGHIFPVFLKFRGGKGVATSFGVFLSLTPVVGIIAVIAWMTAFLMTKISAVAGLSSVITAFVASLALYGVCATSFIYFAIMAIVIFRHIDNIRRIIGKEEVPFGNEKGDQSRREDR